MSRGGRLRRVEPTTTNANGIWTLNEIADYISETKWPRGPAAPTSLTATAGSAQLLLSWTAPATTYGTITNYIVEYTASGGSAQYVLTNSTSTSYTLTGLTNGTAYTVRVAAVNFTAGDYSNAVTATPVAMTVPSVVTSVTSSNDCGFIRVNWQPPALDGGSAITGYRVIGSARYWGNCKPLGSAPNDSQNCGHDVTYSANTRTVGLDGPGGETARIEIFAINAIGSSSGVVVSNVFVPCN